MWAQEAPEMGLGGPGRVLGLTAGLRPWGGAPVVCRGFTTGAVCVVGCEAPTASGAAARGDSAAMAAPGLSVPRTLPSVLEHLRETRTRWGLGRLSASQPVRGVHGG